MSVFWYRDGFEYRFGSCRWEENEGANARWMSTPALWTAIGQWGFFSEVGLSRNRLSRNRRIDCEVLAASKSPLVYCRPQYSRVITFLNKAGMTLSCRGSKKILAHDTWKSLEFNLDVGSITLCLVPQLFMLELMDAWGLLATTWIWQVRAPHFYFLFFLFAACWGRPRYPPSAG
jgi:hypothetical protein